MKKVIMGLALITCVSSSVYAQTQSELEQLAKAKNIARQAANEEADQEFRPRERQIVSAKTKPTTVVIAPSNNKSQAKVVVQSKPKKKHHNHHNHHHNGPKVRYYYDEQGYDRPRVFYHSSVPAYHPHRRYYTIDPYGRKVYIQQPRRVYVEEPVIVEPPRVGFHVEF